MDRWCHNPAAFRIAGGSPALFAAPGMEQAGRLRYEKRAGGFARTAFLLFRKVFEIVQILVTAGCPLVGAKIRKRNQLYRNAVHVHR